MAAAAAFFGILLTSLLVAELAALSLGDFFGADSEFLLVIAGVAGFATFSLIVFAIVYARTERARMLNGTAVLLVLLAVGIVATPGVISGIVSQSGNPFTVGDEALGIALELLVPSALAVLVQWGLVRRRHLRVTVEDDLTLWPWVTTAVAGLVVLSPYGLAFLQATLKRTTGDLMWPFMMQVTVGVACSLIVMAGIECYIRGRLLRSRKAPYLPVARAHV
ncbi:MAG: hypothetical protein K2Y27_27700 [Xanthobacteraceae bacterium]|nr:hypothetical protein [Xanthobacteraceae bacterium]